MIVAADTRPPSGAIGVAPAQPDAAAKAHALGAPSAEPAPAAVASGTAEQRTLLLIVAEEGRAATSITLLTGAEGRASVIFIPTGTLLEVPGSGMDLVGRAASFGGDDAGGADLVSATVENSLGIDVDHAVTVAPDLLADFLGRAGGLGVDIPVRLVDASSKDAEVVFSAGPATLDGPQAAAFWTFRSSADDEFDAFARQQQIWKALLETLSADDTRRDRVIGDGAPQLRPHDLGEDDAGFVGDLLDDLAAAHHRSNLDFELLPVSLFGTVDDVATYRLAGGDAERLVADLLAGSRPTGAADRVRVQVLNGIGVPGVGRSVDALLEGESVEVVLTDNAVDFEQDVTRILVYDDLASTRAAAERVRERLGVGTIERSRQPQSVVDLTIVVGADFSG